VQARFVYKRIVGPKGDFAVVTLHLEPLPRDSGIEVAFECQGTVPAEYWPGVEAGVRDAAREGVDGCAIVDFRARLIDGAYHDIDSSPAAFGKAAAGAFRDAVATSGTVSLS
jgi:elongation factor G